MKLCPYCKQPVGYNELGFAQTSHPHHRPGTAYWIRWYKAEKAAGRYRSEIGDLLEANYDRRQPEREAGLARLKALRETR